MMSTIIRNGFIIYDRKQLNYQVHSYLNDMDNTNLEKRPSLKYSLSSLGSQITKWNSSRPTSPVRNARSTERESLSKQDVVDTSPNIDENGGEQWQERFKPTCLEQVAVSYTHLDVYKRQALYFTVVLS